MPLALAARRDALVVDEREVDLPALARADGAMASTLPVRIAVSASRSAIAFTAGSPSWAKPPTSRFTHLRPSARGFTTRFTRYCTASTSAEESSRALPARGVSETPICVRRLLHLDVHRSAEPLEEPGAELARAGDLLRRLGAAAGASGSRSSRPCALPRGYFAAFAGAGTAGMRRIMNCCCAMDSRLFTKM